MTGEIEKNLDLSEATITADLGPSIDPIGRGEGEQSQAPSRDVEGADLSEGDRSFSGVPLEEYAQSEGFSLSDAWREIKAGKLLSRSFQGRIYVYPDGIAPEPSPLMGDDISALPPLPDRPEGAASRDLLGRELTLDRIDSGSHPEMALLLDHLSLAKEENREILKLTQDSLQKVTSLTDDLVKLKDQVIEAKDVQIEAYKKELDQYRDQLARLQQEKEDLEMLARTYTELSQEK